MIVFFFFCTFSNDVLLSLYVSSFGLRHYQRFYLDILSLFLFFDCWIVYTVWKIVYILTPIRYSIHRYYLNLKVNSGNFTKTISYIETVCMQQKFNCFCYGIHKTVVQFIFFFFFICGCGLLMWVPPFTELCIIYRAFVTKNQQN